MRVDQDAGAGLELRLRQRRRVIVGLGLRERDQRRRLLWGRVRGLRLEAGLDTQPFSFPAPTRANPPGTLGGGAATPSEIVAPQEPPLTLTRKRRDGKR